MEDIKRNGIVLKRVYPLKQAVYFFDQMEGPILVVIKELSLLQRLWPGMMLSYSLLTQRTRVFAEKIEILSVPLGNHYVALERLHRMLQIIYLFFPKNIPQKRVHTLFLWGNAFFTAENYSFFIAIEPWLSGLMLQEAGIWHQEIAIEIDLFFKRLSILIDSFTQHEVDCFYQWICKQNVAHYFSLEQWIKESILEQMYEQKG